MEEQETENLQPEIFKQRDWKRTGLIAAGLLAVVLVGGWTGKVLGQRGLKAGKTEELMGGVKAVDTDREKGIEDPGVFRDTAEGVLREGGIEGEGTHHLEREGGPSKTAYLTSSTVDLDEFVGKKIMVWGETFNAQHAGWLMDVGKVRLLE